MTDPITFAVQSTGADLVVLLVQARVRIAELEMQLDAVVRQHEEPKKTSSTEGYNEAT